MTPFSVCSTVAAPLPVTATSSTAVFGGPAIGFRTPQLGKRAALRPIGSPGTPASRKRHGQRPAGPLRISVEAVDVGGWHRVAGGVRQYSQPAAGPPGGVELRPLGDAMDVARQRLARQLAQFLPAPALRLIHLALDGERPLRKRGTGSRSGREHREVADQVLARRQTRISRLVTRATLERPAHEPHAAASTPGIVSGARSGRKAGVAFGRPTPRGRRFGTVPIGYGDDITSNLEGYRSWSSVLLERTRCVCFA